MRDDFRIRREYQLRQKQRCLNPPEKYTNSEYARWYRLSKNRTRFGIINRGNTMPCMPSLMKRGRIFMCRRYCGNTNFFSQLLRYRRTLLGTMIAESQVTTHQYLITGRYEYINTFVANFPLRPKPLNLIKV